jgi:hypothetical protein
MTYIRFSCDALDAATSRISTAADTFGRGYSQVGAIPRSTGATSDAADLLDRALTATGDALRRAETELQEVSGSLSATAARYQNTERALAAWRVPGGGGGA